MKKINYILFTIVCSLFLTGLVKAAPSAKLTVSSNNITDGKTVTASVTLYNTAAWNVKITSSGNTNGCTQNWADVTSNGANATKTFSTTCRASSTGVISFNLSGDITSSDGSSSDISGTARVTVSAPRPASEVNTLKSLSIDSYELSPSFSEDVTEYSVTVPSTVNIVKINATKKDSASSISGDGEKEVSEGSNKFDIIVTAESGATKTYSIVVNVEDTNPIKETINGIEYSVIKNPKNLTIPSNYTESKVTINGVEVPAFVNDINKLTLVALKDSEGNVKYFTYDNGVFQEYIELTSPSLLIYPQAMPNDKYNTWNKVNITISNNSVEALQYKDQTNYYLIYGMNIVTGEKNYYLYDVKNNSYQVFNDDLYNSLNEDINFYLYMLCGAAGLILICIIIIIVLLTRKQFKKDCKQSDDDAIEEENNIENKDLEENKKEETEDKDSDKVEDESDEEDENIFDDIKKKDSTIKSERIKNSVIRESQLSNKKNTSGLAIAGLVLGIVALSTSFIPIVNNASFIFGIIGLILAIAGLFRSGKKVIPVVAIILCIMAMGITFALQKDWADKLNKVSDDLNKSVDNSTGKNTDEILENYVDVNLGNLEVTKDKYGLVTSKLTASVTNKATEKKSYSITIEALDATGSRIMIDYIYADDIAANQSANYDIFKSISSDQVDSMKNATFKVSEVSMY
jgi:hypothetical protein